MTDDTLRREIERLILNALYPNQSSIVGEQYRGAMRAVAVCEKMVLAERHQRDHGEDSVCAHCAAKGAQAERERCAKIALNWEDSYGRGAKKIYDAIRKPDAVELLEKWRDEPDIGKPPTEPPQEVCGTCGGVGTAPYKPTDKYAKDCPDCRQKKEADDV